MSPYTAYDCFTISCADPLTGLVATGCAASGSIISQRDADKKASAVARQKAYGALRCSLPPGPEPVLYFSELQTGELLCSDCLGPTSTAKSVPAGRYFSFSSVADANAAAAAELALLVAPARCPPLYYNSEQTHTVSCPAGTTGTPSTATVLAGTFCSEVSAGAADAAALADAVATAQAGLVCIPIPEPEPDPTPIIVTATGSNVPVANDSFTEIVVAGVTANRIIVSIGYSITRSADKFEGLAASFQVTRNGIELPEYGGSLLVYPGESVAGSIDFSQEFPLPVTTREYRFRVQGDPLESPFDLDFSSTATITVTGYDDTPAP